MASFDTDKQKDLAGAALDSAASAQNTDLVHKATAPMCSQR